MPLDQISTGYQPEFALGALYHGENAANSEAQTLQQIASSFLDNQRKQEENYRYRMETPNALKKSNAEGMDADINYSISALNQAINALETGGLGGMMFVDSMVQNLSPRDQEIWQQARASGNPLQAFSSMRDNLLNLRKDTAEQRGKVDIETLKRNAGLEQADRQGSWHLKGINANIKGQKDLEQMRIDAGKYNKANKLTVIEQLVKNGSYERAATALSLMAMDEDQPELKQKLLNQAAMYEQMAKEKAAAGGVKPGGIDASGATGLPPQQQTPSRIGAQNKTDPLGIR